jgi:signal transduction histidine kinase
MERMTDSAMQPITDVRSPSAQARLEKLLSTSVVLATEISLERVLQKVTDVATEIIGAHYAAIGVVAPDGRTLESFTTSGISDEDRARIGPPPRGHGILGLVIREARVIRLPDLTKHPDSYGFPPHHPPMHSFLGVPIIGRRGVFGNLYLTEKKGGGLFTDDEYVALLLAAETAAAVENARLHVASARLLEEVQQLHRSRERFFAMVNHELRNALAATYGWAEMLVRRKDPETVPRAAFEVLDSAEQAVKLINDLLDLSRLDEHRLNAKIGTVDVAPVVRRSIVRVTPSAAAKRIRLELDTPRDLPTCETDQDRTEQILVNILGNAVRHAPEGSTVRIELRHEAPWVTIQVDDEGPGVPAEETEHIFDIYVTKAGDDNRGHGVGLPLSRRLARLLRGELRAVHRPGAGGRFVLQLPATGGGRS